MQNYLKLEWAKLPSTDEIVGQFYDRTGHSCTIKRAQFYADAPTLTVVTGNGALILTQEMAAELALVLGYWAYQGKLPEVDDA